MTVSRVFESADGDVFGYIFRKWNMIAPFFVERLYYGLI